MIEKPKRPKKIPNQDNKQPQTMQELIRRYDLDNTKIYDFLDELTGHLNQTQTVVSATEPTGDNREKVWIQKGKNLFNKNSGIILGSFIGSNGIIGTDENLFYQETYIPVKPNTTYTISSAGKDHYRIGEYNSNKTFIERIFDSSGTNLSYTFTTSTNCFFVRISCYISNIYTIQLEEGTEATNLEEPKIYVKNDNGVYEEFINVDNLHTKTKTIWSGNLYETGADKTVLTSEKFEKNKLYLFVLQGLSGSFKITIPYIYGSGNQLQHSYYDGTTVVRWRIVINATGTGFYLDPDCKNMASNTGVREVYKVD